jgi:hypothetical protein
MITKSEEPLSNWLNRIEAPPGVDPENLVKDLNENPQAFRKYAQQVRGSKLSMLERYSKQNNINSIEEAYKKLIAPSEQARLRKEQKIEKDKQLLEFNRAKQLRSADVSKIFSPIGV